MLYKYAETIIRYRWLVIAASMIAAIIVGSNIRSLRVVVDPNTMLPQKHPYVVGTNLAERLFGINYLLVIGVAPTHGTVFRPEVLERIDKISNGLLGAPNVRPETLMSLSAQRAKSIRATRDGLEVEPLMESVPASQADLAALERRVRDNPIYSDIVVAADGRAAVITIAVAKTKAGFRPTLEFVESLVAPLRTDEVRIEISGVPMFLAQIERYTQRMAFLFPIALLLVALLHLEAFRSWQGLFLPLTTAILSVVCALGFMGIAGVPMDAFNSTTPILILAITAGHAVQVLKRYYEEFDRATQSGIAPRDASREAAARAIQKIGPVMVAAGLVAAVGMFSLLTFDIATIRSFGVFTGLGVLSGLVLELTFIPAVRASLPPPRPSSVGRRVDIWAPVVRGVERLAIGSKRPLLYGCIVAIVVPLTYGATHLSRENSYKHYFAPSSPFVQGDSFINERMAGTNTVYLTIDGGRPDAVKDPAFLRYVKNLQTYISSQPGVGKVVSIVDLIERMNAAVQGGGALHGAIPGTRGEVAQYLLLYSLSGDPTDFDRYVDYGYRYASVTTFLKSDSSAAIERLIGDIQAFLNAHPNPGVDIHFGGSAPQSTALAEVLVAGKLKNIAQICFVVLVASAIVFRSIAAAILVVIPLVLTALANFGLMGLLGIPLNTPNAISASMAIGVGADYAIYLLYRIREEVREAPEAESGWDGAIRRALSSAGRAVLYVGASIVVGYAVLMLSKGFYVHIWFGLLIVSSMVVSVLAAMLLVPALCLTFRPAFLRRPGASAKLAPVAAAVLLALVFTGLPPAIPTADAAEETSVNEIMAHAYRVSRFDDVASEAIFRLVSQDGQERVRRTVGYTKMQPNGQDSSRVTRFVAPADIRDTATLLVEHARGDDGIWVYLPALGKVRRLSASNKKDSFLGTDFSYGDVIGHRVDDWTHRVLRKERRGEVVYFVVESIPARAEVGTTSGYARRVSWVNATTYVVEQGEFYDPQGRLLKKMEATGIELKDPSRNLWQPMHLKMTNVMTGHTTFVDYVSFSTDKRISSEYFSPHYLERDW